jgi:hypothetical protein
LAGLGETRPWVVEVTVVVQASSVSRLQVSRALLAVVDQLASEFPELPLAEVYVKVGEARVIAARRLPNVLAYRDVLEREARVRLAVSAEAQ